MSQIGSFDTVLMVGVMTVEDHQIVRRLVRDHIAGANRTSDTVLY
jgi:hypothetical protein